MPRNGCGYLRTGCSLGFASEAEGLVRECYLRAHGAAQARNQGRLIYGGIDGTVTPCGSEFGEEGEQERALLCIDDSIFLDLKDKRFDFVVRPACTKMLVLFNPLV